MSGRDEKCSHESVKVSVYVSMILQMTGAKYKPQFPKYLQLNQYGLLTMHHILTSQN